MCTEKFLQNVRLQKFQALERRGWGGTVKVSQIYE